MNFSYFCLSRVGDSVTVVRRNNVDNRKGLLVQIDEGKVQIMHFSFYTVQTAVYCKEITKEEFEFHFNSALKKLEL